MTLTIFSIIVLIFSIVIHEIAHGSVAFHLGDKTAKYAGRLTLNPLKHLDPVGSVLVPLFMILTFGKGFGWAKPVPVNPSNFKDKRWGELKVSIAGPGANFLIALIFGLAIRFLDLPQAILPFFFIIVFYNVLLGVFNLIPIPPLDGSHILFSFLPPRFLRIKFLLYQYGFLFVILFIFFGLQWLFLIVSIVFQIITGQKAF